MRRRLNLYKFCRNPPSLRDRSENIEFFVRQGGNYNFDGPRDADRAGVPGHSEFIFCNNDADQFSGSENSCTTIFFISSLLKGLLK